MAYQQIPGGGIWIPAPHISNPGLGTSLLMDASGEQAAMIGRVFFKDRTGTKDISKVHFRFGAVTKAGGSTVTVSLQDVSLTAGGPGQPDGTPDQTIKIANADASFVSNTWYPGATLDAARTVSFGDLLAVVFSITDFGGADSVIINSLSNDAVAATPMPQNALQTGGTWATNTTLPNVILEFSDGSFGTLDYKHHYPAAKTLPNTHTAALDTGTADEFALEFQLPFPCKVDAAWVAVLMNSATANFEVILYDGTTAMTNGTVTIDANTQHGATARAMVVTFPAEITLTANTTYRLAARPTVNGQTISTYSVDVNDANHFQAFPGGTTWAYTTRLNQGSWAATTTTRRMNMGIRISSLDDGVQSSEGPLVGGRLIG